MCSSKNCSLKSGSPPSVKGCRDSASLLTHSWTKLLDGSVALHAFCSTIGSIWAARKWVHWFAVRWGCVCLSVVHQQAICCIKADFRPVANGLFVAVHIFLFFFHFGGNCAKPKNKYFAYCILSRCHSAQILLQTMHKIAIITDKQRQLLEKASVEKSIINKEINK